VGKDGRREKLLDGSGPPVGGSLSSEDGEDVGEGFGGEEDGFVGGGRRGGGWVEVE